MKRTAAERTAYSNGIDEIGKHGMKTAPRKDCSKACGQLGTPYRHFETGRLPGVVFASFRSSQSGNQSEHYDAIGSAIPADLA